MTQETTLHIVGTDLLDYSFKVEKAIKRVGHSQMQMSTRLVHGRICLRRLW